jgi:hypothetical protein
MPIEATASDHQQNEDASANRCPNTQYETKNFHVLPQRV